MRILLVEDEMNMVTALTATLSRYNIVVDHVRTLEFAEEACRGGLHDAVILDRKLPDGDGLLLIPVLRREQAGLSVIVLSVLGPLDHRVAGLDHGADDYLAKPFSTDELITRLRAVMRRPARIEESTISIGLLRFQAITSQVAVFMKAGLLSRASSTRCSLGVTPSTGL